MQPPFDVPVAFLSSRQNESLNVYRDAAAGELLSFQELLRLWRFEDQPASALPPDAIYLRGIEISDVILYIAGSDTSQPTASEIVRAVELGKDVICLVLPSDTRTDQVRDLIDRIRKDGTTKDVPAELAGFQMAVTAAVSEWIRVRIRAGGAQTRTAKLRGLKAQSRSRMIQSWMAAGLDEPTASQFADDLTMGAPMDDTRVTDINPFRILVAPVGAGKSLSTERLQQEAIRTAEVDALAPVPIRLRAIEVTSALLSAVETASAGLGSLGLNGVALCLDGLDEVDDARSQSLMQDAWVLWKTYPRSRVLLAGRHLPPQHLRGYVTTLATLSPDSARELMRRVGGDAGERAFIRAPKTIVSTLLRPLFAIILAQSGESIPESEEALIDLLIARGLSRTERMSLLSDALQRLAAEVLDSDDASVPIESFSVTEQEELLRTRLVVEEARSLRIPLRIVAERAAASWLSSKPRSLLLAKIGEPGTLDRWEPAIRYHFRTLDDNDAAALLSESAKDDIVFAIRLAESDPTSIQGEWTAQQLQSAISSADEIFASAFPELVARRRSAIEVRLSGESVDLIRNEYDENGMLLRTMTNYAADISRRHAPFLYALTFIQSLIDDALESRSFISADPNLQEEMLWNQARALLGRGTLSHASLPIADILARLDILPDSPFFAADDGATFVRIDPASLRERLLELSRSGASAYDSPFTVGDQISEGFVWGSYSPSAIVRKRREVMLRSMAAYASIVSRWLPSVRLRLNRILVMPALIYEHIFFIDHRNAPVASTVWYPLPAGSENRVDIELGDDFDLPDVAEELRQSIDLNRPSVRGRIPVSSSSGIIRMWSPWPVQEQVYRWLATDLAKIKLTSHFALPRDRD